MLFLIFITVSAGDSSKRKVQLVSQLHLLFDTYLPVATCFNHTSKSPYVAEQWSNFAQKKFVCVRELTVVELASQPRIG
jgi:hypothetical protein